MFDTGGAEGANALVIIGITVLALAGGALLLRWKDKKDQGKIVVLSNKEARERKDQIVNRRLSDVIGSELLDMMMDNTINDKDYRRLCKKFGSQGLPDLLPGEQSTKPEDVKRRIRLRLRFFNYEPVNIPGEGPTQDIKPKYGQAFLNRFRKPVAAKPQEASPAA